MTQRVLTVAIVCFWLAMTSQLVRLELDPDRSNLLTVPPSHVFKIIFTHEQTSELNILEDRLPVGDLVLNPKSDSKFEKYSLDFSGSLSFRTSDDKKRQRLSWNGKWNMDHSYKTNGLQLTVSLLPATPRQPAYHLHLNWDPIAGQVEYEIREGDQPVKKSSFSADIPGISSLLKNEFDLDPSFLQNIHTSIAPPTLSAKQTEMEIHGEKTLAYLLTIRQGEITVADIYVSQLGQILAVKTAFGYNLNAPDALPHS